MRLRITPAEGDPFDYLLEQESVTVGRSSTADLALSDPFLSRHHARLSRRNDQLLVEDLGSRNGTFVNDQPVQGLTPVKPGDVIRLSASSISLATDRASISTATTHDSGIGATIFKPAAELIEEEISSSTERLDSAEALRSYAHRLETLRDVHEAVAGSLTEEASAGDDPRPHLRASQAAAGRHLSQGGRRRVLPGSVARSARAVDRYPAVAHAGARGARQGHGRAGVRRRHRPALRRLREHHDVGHPLDGGRPAPLGAEADRA